VNAFGSGTLLDSIKDYSVDLFASRNYIEEDAVPTMLRPKFLAPDEGRRLQSGPGRDLVFKVTGDDTGGAFDYFVVEVASHGGPPVHVHHRQEETIHVLSGRFKVRVADEEHVLDPGGFAFMPSGLPHAFVNLADEPAELVVVYTPGGGHRFYEELGPLTRTGTPDPTEIAACFERHDMSLVGPPLSTA
jgi:quercetin dioxygenase-like cupin family protein